MALGLSNPLVRVNGETISIITNSLALNSGTAPRNVRMISNGNNVEAVTTENLEEKRGMVKFMLPNTSKALNLAIRFSEQSQLAAGNTIEVIFPGGEYSFTFTGMAMTNSPERGLSAEGEIEIEFMGPPATETLGQQ